MAAKLEITHLHKEFGDKTVLKDVSFCVEDGEFLSILGASGCGKTTILRILIGLLQSDGGTILKDGADITDAAPAARKMGIVFQNYALFQNMTVLGNIEYALRFDKERKANARAIAEALIEQMGLTEHKNKRPAKLSGGQQQRVAIARTLALNPDVILFDEPMSALDVATRLVLRDELKDLQKKFHSTMIYITHDQEEAFTMSDRIMVMREGNIEQIGTPVEIVQKPQSAYVEEFVLHNLRIKVDALSKFVEYKHG